MTLIVASPQMPHNRLIWADGSGVIRLVRTDGVVESEARSGSLVRAIAWPVPGSVYILFENGQVKVVDPDSLAVKASIEGFSSCIAVSARGTVIGGQLRGRQIRSACFLGRSEDHVLAFADGHLEIAGTSETVIVPPEQTGRGEYESFVAADPEQDLIIVTQAVLGDQAGFSEVSVRLLKPDGTVLHRMCARMCGPAATTPSPIGTLIYEQRGLMVVQTGKMIKEAEGYPLTGLAVAGGESMRLFGIRSDNSLTFLELT